MVVVVVAVLAVLGVVGLALFLRSVFGGAGLARRSRRSRTEGDADRVDHREDPARRADAHAGSQTWTGGGGSGRLGTWTGG